MKIFLNDIDPLPEFQPTESAREIKEYLQAYRKRWTWQSAGKKYLEHNGKGQMRYMPPIPKEKQHAQTKRIPKVGDLIRLTGWEKFYPVKAVDEKTVTFSCGTRHSRNVDWVFAEYKK